ncbi:MAG: hypothetical protein PHD95_06910 [Candidatus ainarchaeum sp.]|nr:hypothetical protein [Candidatus ainarchaeum sp.]
MKKIAFFAIVLTVLFGSIFIAPMASSKIGKAVEYAGSLESVSEKSRDLLVCRGDLDEDGQITFKDITPFVHAFHYQDSPATVYRADISGDGFVDFRDINPFVALIVKGGPANDCLANPTDPETSGPNFGYEGPQCKGDLNHDGNVNFGDINPFAQFLKNHNENDAWYADIDGSGNVDDADINPFVALMNGSAEPTCVNPPESAQWPGNSAQ